MTIDVLTNDRIPMSQKDRDVLQIMHGVLRGERTQAQAACLLGLSSRQVRRIQRKLDAQGDQALVQGLRGQPSKRRVDGTLRQKVPQAYQRRYADFGPTFATEKLAQEGLQVSPQTLRRWLLAEGLWQRKRRRDPHRSRRPRRSCFGELVPMDASVQDWLEGRGADMVLISMIDDATGRVLARFDPAGTTEAHLDRLGRWLRR
jgi:transposase